MSETKTELRRLAEAANTAAPGGWYQVERPWLPRDAETYIIAGHIDPHVGIQVCDFNDAALAGHEDKYEDEEWSARNDILASYIEAFDPPTILEVLDENERQAAEIAVLLKGAELTNKYLDEAVDERIQELGIEADVFDKECISAVRWLLKNKCGDAGTELLDDLDGWSADAAVAVISEEIDRAEASRDAALERLAEAERLLDVAYASMSGAIKFGQATVEECIAEPPEQQKRRLALFNTLDLPLAQIGAAVRHRPDARSFLQGEKT